MSLRNAVRAAIAHENTIHDIRADIWAITYRCSAEDVRAAWEQELTRKSLTPNNYEMPEGK